MSCSLLINSSRMSYIIHCAILSILLTQFCHMKLTVLPTNEKFGRESLTECVANACERFFSNGESIVYSLPSYEVAKEEASVYITNRILTARLYRDLQWSLIIQNVSNPHIHTAFTPAIPTIYIVQIRSYREFIDDIRLLKTFTNWNPHAKFMVVTAGILNGGKELAAKILGDLFRNNVVDGVVLLPNLSNATVFEVFTWFPFDNDNCGDNYQKTITIDTCSFGTFTKKAPWFGDKLPMKFNRCPIRVRMVDLPPFIISIPNGSEGVRDVYWKNRGLEVNLLDLIAELLNLRMFYHYAESRIDWGEVYANGTAVGNLKKLLDGVDDVAIGAYAKTLQRSLAFDDSPPYFHDSLHWCVPHRTIDSKLISITKIIEIQTLGLTLLLYIVVTLLMWLTSQNTIERSCYRNLGNCSQITISVMLGFAVAFQPDTQRVRFFMALLILYSFYLITGYQTILTSVLANPYYVEKYENLDDIIDANLSIYLLSTTLKYFRLDTGDAKINMNNRHVLEKYRPCHSIKYCLEKVAFDSNSAICLPKLFIEYMKKEMVNEDKEPLLYCFDDAIISFPLNVLMRRGFPFYDKFNEAIFKIIRSGLLVKWERDVLKPQRLVTGGNLRSQTLGFANLKIVFHLWIGGCLVAGFVFAMEIIYTRW